METKETLVVMDTTLGKIKFKLYNDTPQPRDNFIKLAKAGQYSTASSRTLWYKVAMSLPKTPR